MTHCLLWLVGDCAGESDDVACAVGSAQVVAWLPAEPLLSADVGRRRTAAARHQPLRQLALRPVRIGVVASGVRRMNEVNARRARLVPGWVTVFGRVYHLGM